MCNMQVATGVLLFLGFAVLASYALFLKCDVEVLWAGVPPPLRYVFLCFMPLAAIGFVYVAITWTLNSPNGWVSSSFTYIMIAFCVFAILWSFGLYCGSKPIVSTSLIVCAALSIVLLQGACMSEDVMSIIALLFVCITTVIFDCVIWHSFYLKNCIKKEPRFFFESSENIKPNAFFSFLDE